MTNPLQPLDPAGTPPAVTPADSPSNPAGFAAVRPDIPGPAWYDIQAPMADLTALVAGARQLSGGGEGAGSGAGMGDVMSPRQAESQTLLSGADGPSVLAGFSGGGGDGWANDMRPGALQTPDQGQMGTYPQSSTR